MTDNDIPDYAPTWQCDINAVVFTSDTRGNPEIFSIYSLPIDTTPINIETDATQLTTSTANDRFPVGTPSEENASR